MKNIEYLKSSFDNIQSLIQFADQKVAAGLVVVTITIGIFFTQLEGLVLSFDNINLLGVIRFIIGLSFVFLNLLILFIGLIKIIRPSFAKNYTNGDCSLYYFEHIAHLDKEVFNKEVLKIETKRIEKELSDQLYEVSKILSRKIRKCHFMFNLLYISLINLALFVLTKNLT